jgi:hypothetical protein
LNFLSLRLTTGQYNALASENHLRKALSELGNDFGVVGKRFKKRLAASELEVLARVGCVNERRAKRKKQGSDNADEWS